MNSFFIYILKASAGIMLVSLPYFLFLRKDPNLRLKRYFLLSGLILSFIAPLLTFHFTSPVMTDNQVFFIQLENQSNGMGNHILSPGQSGNKGLTFSSFLFLLYLAGTVMLVLKNVISMMKWEKFRKNNPENNEHILYSDREEVFSLFRTIHLPKTAIGTEAYSSMLIHEQAHIKQLHFIDLILCETALFLTWFNPFTWLIYRMIKENHEHLADREVLASGVNPVRYRAYLLNQTLGVPVFRLGLAFNYSLTKKRFDMMKNLKSNRSGLIKVLLLVPVLLFSFGCLSNSKGQEGKIKGVVRFADTGQPAEGASIIIWGTTSGTISDANGKFVLTTPGETKIVFSYVGYKTLSETFKPGEHKTVELIPDVVGLQLPEVKTGSKELTITGKDGKPPLYIVDGKEVEDVSNIDPDDIEKIDVIKNKDLLAQNFPGKNTEGGAVLITTKNKEKEESSDGELFYIVEDMPEFPGGKEALSQYIYSRLKYPEAAKGKEGSTVVQFTVDPEGKIRDISIASSTDEIFNEPAGCL